MFKIINQKFEYKKKMNVNSKIKINKIINKKNKIF